MLTSLGYEVAFAHDGAEAIELYAKAMASGSPFDGVIMDLTVPGGMGGKDAVKKLRELYPAAKVIVSSGYSNDPIMADFRTYGFSGVVSKPYTIQNLSETVRALVTQARH
jgi:CheY-like chemotaxis protein